MHHTKASLLFCTVVVGTVGLGGCFAEDEESTASASDELTANHLHCASENHRFTSCDARGKIASVRLVRQVSSARCVQAQPATPTAPATEGNWGFTRGENFFFVDRGCRGDFEVSYLEQLNCASENHAHQRCATGLTNIQSIRLLRQFSQAACREGSSFGFDSEGIFVDRGCRGMFEIVGSRRTP